MKKTLRYLTVMALTAAAIPSFAQKAETVLSIHVNSVAGDNLAGQIVSVTQTDFQVGYGDTKLDAEGNASIKVYEGNHEATVIREGFLPCTKSFSVTGTDPIAITLDLEEQTRNPFALTTTAEHDIFTGKQKVTLTWNTEAPAFFDDFESYDPFSISFGEWSGIDADLEAAAALVGSYPNRGVLQYAQIINPLTVVPTWWYDYQVLRPYDGQQYVGFTRTESGAANDDWLISPEITPGTGNILSFMAKAADQFDERFMVYVTEKTDNPDVEDFIRIDKGNYETVDYKGWKNMTYDLSAYEGKKIKFAIRYISDYNRFRSFMLMIDDVYVGRPSEENAVKEKARRIRRSPANPYETFNIYLDGVKSGETDGYSYVFDDMASGEHTFGVEAVYRAGKSDVTNLNTTIAAPDCAKVTIKVTADSKLIPDVIKVGFVDMASANSYDLLTQQGETTVGFLPCGTYSVHIDEGAYIAYDREFEIKEDFTLNIELSDNVIDPTNITTKEDEAGIIVKWNQQLLFSDSFEDYEDFATGSFGGWTTIDGDKQPVYPIGLGSTSNVVTFPGSGSATNPAPVAPMVFNPWKTTPAMLPTDPAIAAATGDKSIIFFSPQMAKADKWLISPAVEVRPGYYFQVKAKGYTSLYPEQLEFCVSEDIENPTEFDVLAQTGTLTSESWSLYNIPLNQYEGKEVRLAIHYISYDAFLAQIDDVVIGPEDGEGETIDYGNIVKFEIYLDKTLVGEAETPVFTLKDVSAGKHTVGICAVYKSARSKTIEYEFNVTSGVEEIVVGNANNEEIYDLFGNRLNKVGDKGIFIIRDSKGTRKVIR